MIDIYGDSFADPTWRDGQRPSHAPVDTNFTPWYERFGEVNNFAKSAVGPHYCFQELYKRYKDYTKDDHIIFIISGNDRIHFHIPKEFEREDNYQRICPEDILWVERKGHTILPGLFQKNSKNAKIPLIKWYDKYRPHMDYAYRTFKEEIENMTEKSESFLYMISRLQQCKVTVFLLHANCSYMGDRLNDDLFYLHNYSLMDASNEEFIEFDANRFPRWELRQNHFSRENHDIMEDIIRTRIFKPFKKSFIDSTPFEHHEVPGSFIYD
jgi:hypothetical protein